VHETCFTHLTKKEAIYAVTIEPQKDNCIGRANDATSNGPQWKGSWHGDRQAVIAHKNDIPKPHNSHNTCNLAWGNVSLHNLMGRHTTLPTPTHFLTHNCLDNKHDELFSNITSLAACATAWPMAVMTAWQS
jgi:hypothetical protein